MGNDVYANGREVSCKSGDGKSICAFPDVCMTPPENPATPPGVPIPYPNTGMAKDTTSGSKSVKVSNKEVTLKNKSYFKKSVGDEAGSAAKKGVVTSVNRGKVYFNAWSMDVKMEGENVVRHLDITTHNHASFPGNSPTWPFLDSAAFEGEGPCSDLASEVEDNCLKTEKADDGGEVYSLVYATKKGEGDVKRKPSIEEMCDDDDCKDALKCVLTPYSPSNCCPDENGDKVTPHHVVLKSQFKEPGEDGEAINDNYKPNKAPCVCVDGASHSDGNHGRIHSQTNKKTRKAVGVASGKQIPSSKRWTVAEAEAVGAEAVEDVTECPKDCTEEQLRNGHQDMEVEASDEIRPTTAGGEEDETQTGTGVE